MSNPPPPPPLPPKNLLLEFQKDLKQSEMIYNQISETFENNPYTGLTNKKNNCYMNCILQTLFMNLQFTNNILHLQIDNSNQFLLYSLQKLFAKMILKSKGGVISTNEFAASLEKYDYEILEQQDAGEFFCGIVNSLEQELKSTDLNLLMSDLFQGVSENYIICENCQYKSKNIENFTSQFLTVKDIYRKICNNNLEKCLIEQTEIEELKDSNKYFCSQCQCKQEAKKGILIHRFPEFCTFCFNRFILNFQTMKKQKLNDYVSFPFLINLNAFKSINPLEKTKIIEKQKQEEEEQNKLNSLEQTFANQQLKALNQDQKIKLLEENYSQFQQEQINRFQSLIAEDPEAELYELTSIIIHAGGINSGHYFAYIQSLENHRWYKFFDKKVELVDINEIKEKSFGGNRKSCNAQLLFYTKLAIKQVNQYEQFIKTQISLDKLFAIPENLLATIQEEEFAEQVKKQLELSQIQLQIFYNDQMKIISATKSQSYSSLLKQTILEFDIKESIENCRLRFYNLRYNEKKHYVLEDQNQDKTLGELQLGWFTKLYLEIKNIQKDFESYNIEETEIKIFRYKITLNSFDINSEKIKINKLKSYSDLRDLICAQTGINNNSLAIIIKQQEEVSSNWVGRQLLPTEENLSKQIEYLPSKEFFIEKQNENLQWIKYFNELNNLFKVQILNLTMQIDEYSAPESITILFSKTKTFLELQQYIQTNFDEELESTSFGFIMNGKAGVKISNNNLKLESQQPVDNQISVYLDFGSIQKQQKDEIYIHFYYSSRKDFLNYTGDNFEEILEYDKFLNNFTFLGSEIISNNFTPKEIIQQYFPQLSSLIKSTEFSINNIRLREKIGNKLQRVYKDVPLKAQQVHDRKALAFEYTQQPINEISFYKQMTYSEHLIQFSLYDPETQFLGEFYELIVSNLITYEQLAQQIQKLLDLKFEISGTIIPKLNNFTRFLLFEAKWSELNGNTKNLMENPLELETDGKLLIIKDSSKKLQELSPSQMVLIQKHLWKENINYNLL